MGNEADLRLADQVAATVCDAVAAALQATTDPALLDRRLRLLRLVWAGTPAPLSGHELEALAAEAAGHGLLVFGPDLAGAVFAPAPARILLALAAGLAPCLPPPATVAVGGDPAAQLVLAPAPGLCWPPSLTAALGAAGDVGPIAHAVWIARAMGWRPQLLLGAGRAGPLLLCAGSA